EDDDLRGRAAQSGGPGSSPPGLGRDVEELSPIPSQPADAGCVDDDGLEVVRENSLDGTQASEDVLGPPLNHPLDAGAVEGGRLSEDARNVLGPRVERDRPGRSFGLDGSQIPSRWRVGDVEPRLSDPLAPLVRRSEVPASP